MALEKLVTKQNDLETLAQQFDCCQDGSFGYIVPQFTTAFLNKTFFWCLVHIVTNNN